MLKFQVYHGSVWALGQKFTKLTLNYSAYEGFFFSNSWTTAQNYALQKTDLGTPIILEGEVILKSPYYLTQEELAILMDAYCVGEMNKIFRKYKRQGHDSIIYPPNQTGLEIVCFKSKSFKVSKTWIYQNGWRQLYTRANMSNDI